MPTQPTTDIKDDDLELRSFGKEVETIAKAILDKINPTITGLKAELESDFGQRDVDLCEQFDKKLADAQATMTEQITSVTSKFYPPGLDTKEEAPEFNYALAGYAIRSRDWSRAGSELEQMESASKALDSSVDAMGGFIVPAIHSDQLIDRLRAQNVLFQLGITEFPVETGFPIRIPKLSTSTTAVWGDDNEAITPSDVAFEELTLTPRSLRSLSHLPNQLIENSAPVASQVVQNDMLAQFDNALDLAGLNGSGNAQPVGVIQEAGLSTDWGSAINPENQWFSSSTDMWIKLANSNALMGNLGWAMHPLTLQHAMIAENENAGALEVNRKILSEAAIDRIHGYPYQLSTQLPTGSTGASHSGNLIFGNWSDLLLARWTSLVMRASDTAGTSFQSDQTWIRAIMRADFGVRHQNSFCISTGYNL